uniref:Uncharacterized protein TCIL3000_11_7510 n=1 Tax=Trypanosoma congolense (strain IL3000) TaxID=1068625 RepID=G0V0Z4_TRYCI|nr:unnamed protein product [Trypanosoma congolense IL3000]
MTILPVPTLSKSFRSWEVIAGNLQLGICLQQRTDEGMQKNKGIAHRLFYSEADLKKYRIIRSSNPVDYRLTTGASEDKGADAKCNGKPRYVLASSDTFEEISADWNRVRAKGPSAYGLKKILGDSQTSRNSSLGNQVSEFSDFERFPSCFGAALEKSANSEWKDTLEISQLSDWSVGSRSSSPSPLQKSSVDAYEKCLIRIMGLWGWSYPIDTAAYVIVLSFGWWYDVLRWPAFFMITLITGFIRCGQAMSSNEEDEGKTRLGYVHSLFNEKRTRTITIVLLIAVTLQLLVELLLPQLTIVSVLERLLPPLVVVSLLHCALVRFFSHLSASVRAAWSPIRSRANSMNSIRSKEKSGYGSRDHSVAKKSVEASPSGGSNRITPSSSPVVRYPITSSSRLCGWEEREEPKEGFVVWEKRDACSKTNMLVEVNLPSGNVKLLQSVLAAVMRHEKHMNCATNWCKVESSQNIVSNPKGNEFTLSTTYKFSRSRCPKRKELSPSPSHGVPTAASQDLTPARYHTRTSQEAVSLHATNKSLSASESLTTLPDPLELTSFEELVLLVYDITGLEQEDGSLRLRVCYTIKSALQLSEYTRCTLSKQLVSKAEAVAEILRDKNIDSFKAQPNQNVGMYMANVKHHPFSRSSSDIDGGPVAELKSDEICSDVIRISSYVVKELFLRDDWKFQAQKKGVSLWTACTQWTDKKAVKLSVHIPGVTLGDVDAVINDPKLVSRMDAMVASKTFVREASPQVHVYHTKFNSPFWGIAARDVVTRTVTSYYPTEAQRSAMGLNSKASIFLHVSEDASNEVPPQQDFQRGRVFAFGVMAETTVGEGGEEGVRLTRCVAADPGGSLPSYIVNALTVLQLDSILTVTHYIKKHAKSRVCRNVHHGLK